jgi:glycosyltransferase involved in cell wall biosynthesis
MKVCHFIASSQFGGAERVVMQLCNALADKAEVHLIAFGDGEHLKGLSPRVHLHTFDEFKRYNLIALYKLLKLIRTINPDIIHTHGAKASRIIHTIAPRLKAMHVATKHNARKGRIFNRLEHVIAVSKRVQQSIKSNHATVIYNGIDPKPVKCTVEKHPGICKMVAIGRLDAIKGFDILIRKCAELHFPFELTIVGEGRQRKTLERLIDELNLNESVKLVGFRRNIPQLMCEHDAVIISSHSEGFSLVMVEALFYAKVLLSTRVGGAQEILHERFIFTHEEFKTKLEDLYHNYDQYKVYFQQLSKTTRGKFLLSTMAQKHLAYYQELIDKRC